MSFFSFLGRKERKRFPKSILLDHKRFEIKLFLVPGAARTRKNSKINTIGSQTLQNGAVSDDGDGNDNADDDNGDDKNEGWDNANNERW